MSDVIYIGSSDDHDPEKERQLRMLERKVKNDVRRILERDRKHKRKREKP